MRRLVLWGASTVTMLVLLLGYPTSTSSTNTGPASVASGAEPGSVSRAVPTGSRSVTGTVAQTQWGPVQVQLALQAGRISDVAVLQYPTGNPRDAQINGVALPILVQETLDAQSAEIDMVSGATVTSVGYLTSLQAALDEAGL